MGTDSNWCFRSHFECRVDAHVITTIGQNLVNAVPRFAAPLDADRSRVLREASKFFMPHSHAARAIVDEMCGDGAGEWWSGRLPAGLIRSLPFSDWTPQEIFATVDPPKHDSMVNRWYCELSVYEMLPHEFRNPNRRSEHGFRPPKGVKCPSPTLAEADFASVREWRIYSDMLRMIPEQLDRVHWGWPGSWAGRYWPFNLVAMCYAFASSISGVKADRFVLLVPGSIEKWTWDRDGVLIDVDKDEAYYAANGR
jgi:hypothetical protein